MQPMVTKKEKIITNGYKRYNTRGRAECQAILGKRLQIVTNDKKSLSVLSDKLFLPFKAGCAGEGSFKEKQLIKPMQRAGRMENMPVACF